MTSAEGGKRSRRVGSLRSGGLLPLLVALACGTQGSSGGTVTPPSGMNVLPITVNGSLCLPPPESYINEPCLSVTVCTPGTNNCQEIPGILLDSGSTGLRVFKSVLAAGVSPTPINTPSGTLAECISFVDGSSDWGPVEIADVVLGEEQPVQVPIHILDSTYAPLPAACPNPEASPSVAGYNGILGIAVFAQDCGSDCTTADGYFACSGSSCTPFAPTLSEQVANPIALLPLDNNGVVVELPTIPSGGAPSATGALVLGIGTRSNNTPAGVHVYPLDPSTGFLVTEGDGISAAPAFVDTGSNGFFFTPPAGSGLVDCVAPDASWFCPTATVGLSPTMIGIGGNPQAQVTFSIGNFDSLISGSAAVFSDIGGGVPSGQGFDWGLPFFFGRTVYLGIEQKSSKQLGTGPYVAW